MSAFILVRLEIFYNLSCLTLNLFDSRDRILEQVHHRCSTLLTNVLVLLTHKSNLYVPLTTIYKQNQPLRSPNYKILFENGIYLMGTIEPFADLESPLFVNRIRYDVGLGTPLTDAWRVHLRYVLQQGRDSASSAFSTDEHILRLRLFYTFK